MPRVKAGLACPLCDAEKVESELYVEAGAGGARTICGSGNMGHVWTDQDSLKALLPRRLKLAPRPDAVQTDHVTLQLSVPASTKKVLEEKYGERLSTSLTSVLQACADPAMMLLNAVDLQRIEERLGQKPKSSSELFGLLFQLGEEVKQWRNDCERLKRQMGVRGGSVASGVTVDLGDWMSKGVAKAADSGVSLEEFLGKYLRDSLENDWITS
jgi:hypothetical protein